VPEELVASLRERKSMKRNNRLTCTSLLLLLCTLALMRAGLAADEDEHGARYRSIGPAAGGRTSRVVGVPGDPLTYYVATAAGGVWKSVNGGQEWKPVFDDQPVSSIGSIAVAPSDANVVYVGTGEANIRGNVAEGNGIYKSTDGGKTWSQVWRAEGQIGTMIVHPADADVAFAAVLGSPFGPGPDRGVYRTTDGGQNWEKVLYVDPNTGASDVTFDGTNPRTLFAGMWQVRRTPWDLQSGGAGSGMYVSHDSGEHWTRLTGEGLPDGIWGKVGVRVSPSEPNRVYALIEAEEGGLFRSDDAGKNWKRVNASRGLRQRAWYYTTLTVDPHDANVVWFPNVHLLKTIDGGKSALSVKGGGWDYHDVWIDPEDGQRMAIASDAGVSLTRDGGKTWVRPPLPIGQFYHLSVDTRIPYRVLGSLQDFGTRSGPSNSLHEGGIFLSDWHPVGGGEAGYAVADPEDPQIVYAGEYLGYLSRYDERTGEAPHVGIYPDNGSGHPASDLRHRFQWTSPIVISPHDPKLVYHASNTLQMTRDGGQSWEIISPDLTRNDKTKQAWAGGPITGDNTGVEFYDTIFSVAESPVEAGVIWAGSDDGLVHVTRDGGGSWNDVTPKGLPEWATVSIIEASRWRAGSAYVVVDAHRLDDETPYLWKTEDYGRSWTSLTAGLDPEIYLHVVREDTRKEGLLYLGTERGVMLSRDDGASWESLRLNLPTVAVRDMTVAGDDLVVGTCGRSAWILDDLTPIREMTPGIAARKAYLFEPLPAIRWTYASPPAGSTDGKASNPPKGVSVSYHLAEKPTEEIKLDVLDASGTVIKSLSSKLEPPYIPPDHPDFNPNSDRKPALEAVKGMNRGAWDLTYEGAARIPGATNDAGDVKVGPLVPPGHYRLRLHVAGDDYEQPLTVLPDPRSNADIADMKLQTQFMLGVRDKITDISEAAIKLKSLREQIAAQHARLSGREDASDLLAFEDELSGNLSALEGQLYNPKAEVNYDILAGREGGAKLYSRFGWLYRTALEYEGPPTQGMREVDAELTQLLRDARAELTRILSTDVPRLNELAARLGLGYVNVPE
jgi:photosystem II stability/assembly factor-like uncharacterized protein